MDLTAPHRVPLSWLAHHGGESVRLRTLRELAPPGQQGLDLLQAAVLEAKTVTAIVKRQKDSGLFGGNFLGIAPSIRDGIKEAGTVAQYRRLLQLGYPRGGRAFKLAERLLFRALSRDEDPALLFEHQKLAKEQAVAAEWLRDQFREELGLPLITDVQQSSLNDAINALSPLVANNVLSNMTINEKRQLANLPPIAGGDSFPSAAPKLLCQNKTPLDGMMSVI